MTIHRDREPSRETELSPFELKDELIRYARDFTVGKAATHKFLNAGRGNPNWVATTPREAFFLLGGFALEESRRIWSEPSLGGMPHADGAADRLRAYLARQPRSNGNELLAHALDYAVDTFGFDEDAFVHELADATIGDNYPEPDRMLTHAERVVHRYVMHEMCGSDVPAGRFDLFATEGGTAAMCYVFRTLASNGILKPGDTIALGTPIFTPYLEIPKLKEYGLETVEIAQSTVMANGQHTWSYPDSEIDKLADPRIKAFFTVNPSNPASFAVSPAAHARLQKLVTEKRPDLIILTDDVYGTFVPNFRSFAATLPHNTILVYSFSKYFGCTGWRLGVIGLHEDNVLDRLLRAQPNDAKEELRRRYASLTDRPEQLKFIDRLVADSRDVALNHTAGLSGPQQAQMTLFSLSALIDRDGSYKLRASQILRERLSALERGLGFKFPHDPLRAGYYIDIDLAVWGKSVVGDEFVEYVRHHHAPLDIVLNLARKHGTVLLNGSGFDGPPWSIRISLANLDAEDYETIGRDLAELCRNALAEWRASAS